MIAGAVASLLERPLVVRDNSDDRLDAIVVLGAPLHADGSRSAILDERLAAAAALYRAGAAPRVVVSGGVTREGVRPEAAALAEGLLAHGVPEDAILVEAASRSTAENARFVRQLVGPCRIWIVTQPFHGRRAARLFRAAGFEPRVWHIDGSVEYRDRMRAVRWLVREYAAWAKLFFKK